MKTPIEAEQIRQAALRGVYVPSPTTDTPVETPKPPADDEQVERVARDMWALMRRRVCSWDETTEQARTECRRHARAAIAAMGGGKRWGVWDIYECVWVGTPPALSDEAVAKSFCNHYNKFAGKELVRAMEYVEHPKQQVAGLEVTYTVPDGMSDDDAIEHICKHLGAINDLHRAVGGNGLRVLSCSSVDYKRKGADCGSP
jgi:hypothetical protein